jgi:hypothetical protein
VNIHIFFQGLKKIRAQTDERIGALLQVGFSYINIYHRKAVVKNKRYVARLL